jgi:hypothetical protein
MAENCRSMAAFTGRSIDPPAISIMGRQWLKLSATRHNIATILAREKQGHEPVSHIRDQTKMTRAKT